MLDGNDKSKFGLLIAWSLVLSLNNFSQDECVLFAQNLRLNGLVDLNAIRALEQEYISQNMYWRNLQVYVILNPDNMHIINTNHNTIEWKNKQNYKQNCLISCLCSKFLRIG